MRAELAVACGNKLGEGAFWHPDRRRLFWLDVPEPSALHILDPETGEVETHEMPQMIASMRPWGPDALIVAAHGGLCRYDLGTRDFARAVEVEPELPFNRCNDGGTDAQGRFLFGTMQNNISPAATDIELVRRSGTLWRLDPDLSLVAVETGILISNTLCVSPDGTVLYFCDTAEGVIRAYDYDPETGTPSNRRDLFRHERGVPDGATVDADGGLWSARWDGGCVVRFLPDGSVDRVIEVPAAQVTSVAFGGPELDRLYITTARWGAGEHPGGGHLYVAEPGVRGLPVTGFAGAWTG